MTSPLVLLHGFTGDAGSFDELAALLPPTLGVHRVTLLGHDGAPPASATSFDGEVDGIAADLRRAGATGLHLVGYSLGARVGLGLLARHGDLFARATLVGVHPGLEDEAERRCRRAADERWAGLLEQGIDRFVLAWEAQPLFASQARLPAAVRARERARRRRHHPAGLALALRTLGLGVMPAYAAALAATPLPVTLVAGADDPRFLALANGLVPTLPRARVRAVPSAGHNVVLEQARSLATLILEDPS